MISISVEISAELLMATAFFMREVSEPFQLADVLTNLTYYAKAPLA